MFVQIVQIVSNVVAFDQQAVDEVAVSPAQQPLMGVLVQVSTLPLYHLANLHSWHDDNVG